MIINQDAPPGKKWVTVEEHYICPYHREHRGYDVNWAGCTCSSSYMQKLVDKDTSGEERGG